MSGVTYESLAQEITRKYEERERKIEAMQTVASGMCHVVIRQLNIPSGLCRIGAFEADGSFVPYAWDIKEDGSLIFAIQVDYHLGEESIVRHHASFQLRVNGGEVNVTCLEGGGGTLVTYAPEVNKDHLGQAAHLAILALRIKADKFRG